MSQELESAVSGSIYEVYDSTHQDYISGRMPRVGQKAKYEDGREFVFCSTAVDLAAGQAVSAPECIETTAVTAASEGDTEITSAAITAAVNLFAGGYMVVVLGTGVGYVYRIKSNTAAAAATSTITLYDPLQTDLAATDDITFVPMRCKLVLEGIDAGDPVGIAVAPSTAATDSLTNYLWVQYKGVAYGQTCQVTDGQGVMVGASGTLVAVDATGTQVGVAIEEGATNGVVNVNFPT